MDADAEGEVAFGGDGDLLAEFDAGGEHGLVDGGGKNWLGGHIAGVDEVAVVVVDVDGVLELALVGAVAGEVEAEVARIDVVGEGRPDGRAA